tara:strand:+ start:136 stop:390 length:255 start_codon:yes stop_codon:yes gene_type:complete
MNVQQIKTNIRRVDNLTDLRELANFISECKTLLGRTSFGVGDEVWVVQKTKRTEGVVTKMNRTKALVAMRGGEWRVPFSMLEAR